MMLLSAMRAPTAVAAMLPCTSTARAVATKAALTPDPLKAEIEPWPYRDRSYTCNDKVWDGTYKRITDQSRIIIVEGNIGSGKSTVAKRLADELGFYLIPEFSLDMVRTNSYGIDQKSLYDDIPFAFQYGDIHQFYADPNSVNVAEAQRMMLFGRHEQWCNAMAHMMNTGQGVVLERSIFSDFVFVNAMRAKNIVSPQWFRFYHYFRRMIMSSLDGFYPHLFVYLDAPVDKCMRNIGKRAIASETNCAFLDENYLNVIDRSYKDMLAEMRRHSKLLIVDWKDPTPDSVDRVVEDVEKVDLDFFEWHSMTQFESWYELDDDIKWGEQRYRYTNKPLAMAVWDFYGQSTDVPEFPVTLEDREQYIATLKKRAFKGGYAHGMHPEDLATNWNSVFRTFHGEWATTTGLWYEHFYKDAFFSADPGTFRSAHGDWSGDIAYTPGYARGHH